MDADWSRRDGVVHARDAVLPSRYAAQVAERITSRPGSRINMGDIGPIKRIIEVEPIPEYIPQKMPINDPVKVPEPEKEPVKV